MSPDQRLPAANPITLDLKLNQLIQRVDTNVTQEIIVTTADKARLCLIDALGCLERKKAWIAPASILATLGVVLPTIANHYLPGFSGRLEGILEGDFLVRNNRCIFVAHILPVQNAEVSHRGADRGTAAH